LIQLRANRDIPFNVIRILQSVAKFVERGWLQLIAYLHAQQQQFAWLRLQSPILIHVPISKFCPNFPHYYVCKPAQLALSAIRPFFSLSAAIRSLNLLYNQERQVICYLRTD